MNALQKFKTAASTFALGAMMLANTSCDKSEPGVDPVKPGGGTGTGTETKITEVVLGNAAIPSQYVVYNPVDSTFQVDAGSGSDKSSIKLKPTSNPNAHTINKDGFIGLLNDDNIDVSKTLSTGTTALASLKNSTITMKISADEKYGKYIGQGSTEATANNKVVFSQYAGTKDLMIINAQNGGLSQEQNVQKMVTVLRAIEEGKLGLEIIGKGAEKGGVNYNMGLIAN